MSSGPTVSSADATQFPAPSGTKITTDLCDSSGDPVGCDPNGPPEESYPVLLYNGYTYWPLSYDDNRNSFAIVVTLGSTTDVINVFEAQGARYIDSIQVSSGNETVNFIGKSFQAASVPWSTLTEAASSASSSETSAATTALPTGATTLPSSTLTLPSASSTSTSTPKPSAGGHSLSGGAIAGVAIGSVIGGLIIFLVGWYIIQQLSRQTTQQQKTVLPPPATAKEHQQSSGPPPSPPADIPPGQLEAWKEIRDRQLANNQDGIADEQKTVLPEDSVSHHGSLSQAQSRITHGQATSQSYGAQSQATAVNRETEDGSIVGELAPPGTFPAKKTPTSPQSMTSGRTGGSYPSDSGLGMP